MFSEAMSSISSRWRPSSSAMASAISGSASASGAVKKRFGRTRCSASASAWICDIAALAPRGRRSGRRRALDRQGFGTGLAGAAVRTRPARMESSRLTMWRAGVKARAAPPRSVGSGRLDAAASSPSIAREGQSFRKRRGSRPRHQNAVQAAQSVKFSGRRSSLGITNKWDSVNPARFDRARRPLSEFAMILGS